MTWEVSEKAQLMRLAIATAIGFGLAIILAWISPHFYPSGDPYGLLRTLFQQGVPILQRAVFGLWVLMLVDFVTTSPWLDRVGESSHGPAILLSVFMYCVLIGG